MTSERDAHPDEGTIHAWLDRRTSTLRDERGGDEGTREGATGSAEPEEGGLVKHC